jgi:hypothetical protein
MHLSLHRSPAWLLLLALPIVVPTLAHAHSGRMQIEQSEHDRDEHRAKCAPTEDWHLVKEYQFFLQDPPNSLTGLYRTQGMATDGRDWFFSWQFGLEKTDHEFNTILRNSSVTLPLNVVPGIPTALLAQGLDHIGDIDYHNGIIYASLDTTNGYTNGHVALYNASDLSYTGITYELTGAPSNPKHDIASWVAVDEKRNVGYGKEYQSGNTINVYDLHTWKFLRTLTMDMAVDTIQGAKVHGDWLYMSSNNATQSVYRANLITGHVEELFQLPTPAGDREVEGIALADGPADDVEMYIYMVVDPDRVGNDLTNTHSHLSLFHYSNGPEREARDRDHDDDHGHDGRR